MKLIGNSNAFAVRIEILEYEPLIGKTALIVKGKEIGFFNSEERIAPFVRTLNQLAISYPLYQNTMLNGKSPEFIYDVLIGNDDGKQKFTALQIENERHLLSMGENFDQWFIMGLYQPPDYLFIWQDVNEPVSQNIYSTSISLSTIQSICLEVNSLIPEEYWPRFMDRFTGT